jgi:hypothetical protein
MKKKIISMVCLLVLIFGLMPAASAAGFTDVPADSWAVSYIDEAVELGVMGGYGDGQFGYGRYVSRAEFAAMLVRRSAGRSRAETPSFDDNNDQTAWYYDEIETAVLNGAVTADSGTFRPDDYITREEMP